MMRRTLAGWALGLLVAGAAGCGQKPGNDVRDFVKKVRSAPVEPIKPPPEIAAYEPFTYNASGKRSPFKAAETEAQPKSAYVGPQPDPARPREPLEQYSLDALTMMGSVTENGTRFALIRTPDGVIYRIRAGQYMGGHSGKVLAVRDARVTLREIVPKSAGGYEKRKTAMIVGQ